MLEGGRVWLDSVNVDCGGNKQITTDYSISFIDCDTASGSAACGFHPEWSEPFYGDFTITSEIVGRMCC